MPKGKNSKKRFDKKTAAHYYLVNRSQQDPRYETEGSSQYVLQPANDVAESAMLEHEAQQMAAGGGGSDGEGGFGDDDAGALFGDRLEDTRGVRSRGRIGADDVRAGGAAGRSANEVDEYGFPVDGYDYQKHLREMGRGGGAFVDPSAGRADPEFLRADPMSKRTPVVVPDDVADAQAAAAGEEISRGLEAIVLDDKRMDPEIRAALEDDGEEEFEELGDDWNGVDLMDALMGNEDAHGPGDYDYDDEDGEEEGKRSGGGGGGGGAEFDYEAHIAALMEAAGDDEEEDEEAYRDGAAAALSRPPADRKARLVDEQFEVALAREYDDDQIGELDDLYGEEELMGRHADDSALLDSALDEFLEDKAKGETGLETLVEESRQQGAAAAAGAKKAGGGAPASSAAGEEEEETKKDKHGDEDEEEDGEAEEEPDEPIWVGVGPDPYGKDNYLAERPKEVWDCATIVSTYSTLENHPSLLRAPTDPNSRGARRRRKQQLEAAEEAAYEAALEREKKAQAARAKAAAASRAAAANPPASLAAPAAPAKKIVLSKKTGLPLGVLESRGGAAAAKTAAAKTASSSSSSSSSTTGMMDLRGGADDDDDFGDLDLGGDGAGDWDPALADAGARTDELLQDLSVGAGRNKKETAEEKKERKKLVKAQRAAARRRKKDMKGVYKDEEQRQVKRGTVAAGAVKAGAHVFRY